MTQVYHVTAWFRMRCGSDGAGLAGSFASAVTERVSRKVAENCLNGSNAATGAIRDAVGIELD